MENLEAQVLDVSKVKIIPSDTEIPVYNNSIQTERALCTEFPQNKEILHRLEAIFNPLNVTECSDDLFKDDYETIVKIEDLKKALSELLIRFDTNPQNYTKKDYFYLMGLIYKALLHLYDIDARALITANWLEPHSDEKIPSEKLVKETIDYVESSLDNKINNVSSNLQTEIRDRQAEISRVSELISNEEAARILADSQLDDKISQEISNREAEITRVEGLISEEQSARQLADQNLQNTKQDNLTAGDNISIINNTISAVDTIYDDTEVRGLIDAVDQKVDNLDEFTCGTIVPTTTNFVEDTDYTVHEALQRTANLFEGYQGEIDDINALIPNQTTTQNQLADKAFVNSTVATNAANFRGNWVNFTTVPTNASDYPADYTGSKTPSNNDYLVVQDGTDYDPLDTGMWRFIYIGTWEVDGKLGWHPQYRVGSAFTAEQQAAIDSGITQSKVTKYDNYNTTIGALQTDKLDKVYTANKVYGTNNLGVQIAYTAGTGIAFENGQIKNTTLPLILAAL